MPARELVPAKHARAITRLPCILLVHPVRDRVSANQNTEQARGVL